MMGSPNPSIKKSLRAGQADLQYAIDWATLGEFLKKPEKLGITLHAPYFVGVATVRANVLSEQDIRCTSPELAALRGLFHQSVEGAALSLTTKLTYTSDIDAKTSELIDLANESARCGGVDIPIREQSLTKQFAVDLLR